MATHLLFGILLLLAAAFFALLEIQIEGEEGWAGGLPTWRIEGRWPRRLLGGRALTGYHLYAHLVVLTLAHSAYAVGLPVSWSAEARIAGFVVLFWIAEDFLWFLFNPAFGLRRFRPEHIPWHRHSWWWIMPREYWIGLPIGLALYALGT